MDDTLVIMVERVRRLVLENEELRQRVQDLLRQLESENHCVHIPLERIKDYMLEMGYGWEQAYWELIGAPEEDLVDDETDY
jgi:hypothetical protein